MLLGALSPSMSVVELFESMEGGQALRQLQRRLEAAYASLFPSTRRVLAWTGWARRQPRKRWREGGELSCAAQSRDEEMVQRGGKQSNFHSLHTQQPLR